MSCSSFLPLSRSGKERFPPPPPSMINCFTSWKMEEKASGKGKTVIPCDAGDKVMDASVAKHFLMFISSKCEFVGGCVLD